MIREATLTDVEKILDLSAEFWATTQFTEAYDRDHTRLMVNVCLDQGLLAVLVVDGDIVGFIAGIKSFLLASQQALMATELAWWVDPEHRKGSSGLKLLKFMEKLAQKQGIKYWSMVSMECSSPETAEKIYLSMGYKKSETNYMKVF